MIISNIDGTVRTIFPGRSGDFLPYPLNVLSTTLREPLYDPSAQPTPVPTEPNPRAPLHGIYIGYEKLNLEEELRASSLFTKQLSVNLPLDRPIKHTLM